jgi:hypothetical protein
MAVAVEVGAQRLLEHEPFGCGERAAFELPQLAVQWCE